MKRQVVVERPDSGLLWGIKIQGGRDFGQKLRITEINKDGLLAGHGLRTGSEIVSIGGEPTASMTHLQAQEAFVRCGNRLQLEIVEPSFAEQPTLSTQHSEELHHLKYASEAQPYRPYREENGRLASAGSKPQIIQPPAEPISSVDNKTVRVTTNITWNPQAHTTTIASQSTKPYEPLPEAPKPYSANAPNRYKMSNSPTDSHNTVPSEVSETVCLKKPSQTSLSGMPVYGSSPSPIQIKVSRNENTSPSVYCSSGDERIASLPGTVLANASKRPVCFSCRREIHGPFVDTGSLCFCQEHFNCEQCGVPLAEQQYSESNGKFYCAKDFVQLVAPRCAKCSQPIVGLITKALGKNWHPQCFICVHCHKQLRDVFHVEDTGEVLCKEHWEKLHLKACASCKQPISEIDRFIEAFDKCFHAQCFCCAACRTPLEGKMFHPRDGKPFCPVHAKAQALYS
ncbi:PDZ and LIM domain protein 7 [Clonorchis sinensis]|uniref:PDZ and LIM domain protein 7 n=2 Tax=Clonorchis sinensis TaxID=79923 RepID=A0A8T1MPK8_CLOSI|nr:PDZ and LIM domain protein 7 [Clonorchis sinensis]GAA37796.1 PDZ and LIM domain protein 7 [Clonorchis sinensis]